MIYGHFGEVVGTLKDLEREFQILLSQFTAALKLLVCKTKIDDSKILFLTSLEKLFEHWRL